MVPSCPICGSPCLDAQRSEGKSHISCPRCGQFTEGQLAAIELPTLNERQVANASGFVRENAGIFVGRDQVNFFKQLRTPSVSEKADKLLLQIAKLFPTPGELVRIDPDSILRDTALLVDVSASGGDLQKSSNEEATQLRWLSIAWAMTAEELNYLVQAVLVGNDFIRPAEEGFPAHYRMAPNGWAKVDDLSRGTIASDKGFVAMSFHDDFKRLFTAGLEPGIRQAGYEPVRMDRVEHNNRIDDEIIASIRRCKFLVADFSVNRGGIYFEAGFAMGLGRPVIWTVREDQKGEIHFDNRQYNFIRWDPEKIENLATALQNRIEATIGKGPLG